MYQESNNFENPSNQNKISAQELELRARSYPAFNQIFGSVEKSLTSQLVTEALPKVEHLVFSLEHNYEAARSLINDHFFRLAASFGGHLNGDYIESCLRFLDRSSWSYAETKYELFQSLEDLVKAFGDNLSNQKFEMTLCSASRIGGEDGLPSSVIQEALVPAIKSRGDSLTDGDITQFLDSIKNWDDYSDINFGSMERPKENFVGEIYNPVQSNFQRLTELRVVLSMAAPREAVAAGVKRVIAALGGELNPEKIEDLTLAAHLFDKKKLEPSLQFRFATFTAPLILNLLGNRYQPGDLMRSANIITEGIISYSNDSVKIRSEDEIERYLQVVELSVSPAKDKFRVEVLEETVSAIETLYNRYERYNVKGAFAALYGVLPILRAKTDSYSAKLLGQISEAVLNEVRSNTQPTVESHTLIYGISQAMVALGAKGSISDIKEVAQIVRVVAKQGELESSRENLLVSRVFTGILKAYPDEIFLVDLRVIGQTAIDFNKTGYSSIKLEQSLLPAITQLGFPHGVGFIVAMMKQGISPRLDLLSPAEIHEVFRMTKYFDENDLIRARRELSNGSHRIDGINKMIALDIANVEMMDEIEGRAIVQTLGRDAELQIRPPLDLSVVNDSFRVLPRFQKYNSKITEVKTLETVILKATKGVIDELHGALAGRPIYPGYNSELQHLNFQPIRMTDLKSNNLGVIYALRSPVFNKDSLIIVSIEPSQDFLGKVDPRSFSSELTATLKKIATFNGAKLYFNTGSYDWKTAGGISPRHEICEELERQCAGKVISYLWGKGPVMPFPYHQKIEYLAEI